MDAGGLLHCEGEHSSILGGALRYRPAQPPLLEWRPSTISMPHSTRMHVWSDSWTSSFWVWAMGATEGG